MDLSLTPPWQFQRKERREHHMLKTKRGLGHGLMALDAYSCSSFALLTGHFPVTAFIIPSILLNWLYKPVVLCISHRLTRKITAFCFLNRLQLLKYLDPNVRPCTAGLEKLNYCWLKWGGTIHYDRNAAFIGVCKDSQTRLAFLLWRRGQEQ